MAQAIKCQYGRVINAALKNNRTLRAQKVADKIAGHMTASKLHEVWRCLKGWYRVADDRPPKLCFTSRRKQTTYMIDLYIKVKSPGTPIPINIEPIEVNNEVPGDRKIRTAVKRLHNGRAGGISGISGPRTLKRGSVMPLPLN